MRKHPLKSWREANGLTQDAAARRVGVTKQCWQQWEAGQRIPDSGHVRKLMKLAGVTADQLYAWAAA